MTLLHEEAKGLAWLSIPITLAAALDLAPPVVVSMMIGQASGDQSSQVVAAGGLSDFFMNILFLNVSIGLGMATSTMCSKAFGAKQYTQFWLYAQAALLAAAYMFVPVAIIGVNGAGILKALGQDHELTPIANKLILINLASIPFTAVFTIIRSALQAQNVAIPFLVVSAVAYSISLPLGYVLGNYTSLGYIGVALTTILSAALQALGSVPILLKNKLFVDAWPGWQWRQAHGLVGKLWPIGVGSVLMTTFQSAGIVSTTPLSGYLPDPETAIAASSIAMSFITLSFIPIFGVATAGVVRIGNAVGSRQADRTALATRIMFFTLLGVSVVEVVICWSLANKYVRGFVSDEPTITLATRLALHLLPVSPLIACLAAGSALFQVCEAQALCAALNCVFMLGVGVGAGLLFGFVGHGGVFGLWNGQFVGICCVLFATILWYRRLDWQHQIGLVHAHCDPLVSEDFDEMKVAYSQNSTGAESDSIVFMRHRSLSSEREYNV